MPQPLIAYTDFKSPYAFLAKDPTWALAAETGIEIDWRPYTLDVPSYLGDAVIGESGEVLSQDRTPHQWRRVRYMFMDAKRRAKWQNMTLRSTTRIYDSSRAAIGLLWAKQQDPLVLQGYIDTVFTRFWRRELDLENVAALTSVLEEAGADVRDFADYLAGEGRAEHDRTRAEAEEMGVFGCPTFVLDGELFWGNEHISLIRERLSAET